VPGSDASSSLTAPGATACAINADSSDIAVCRCCSPTSSHNATAGAGLSANSRRNCTIGPRRLIIALAQDGTLKQRLHHPPCGEQVIERAQRPSGRRWVGRRVQVGPRGRNQKVAAVRQHQDQLKLAAPAHPAQQLKRLSLPRVPPPQHPHRRREAIEVGLMSCLPSIVSATSG